MILSKRSWLRKKSIERTEVLIHWSFSQSVSSQRTSASSRPPARWYLREGDFQIFILIYFSSTEKFSKCSPKSGASCWCWCCWCPPALSRANQVWREPRGQYRSLAWRLLSSHYNFQRNTRPLQVQLWRNCLRGLLCRPRLRWWLLWIRLVWAGLRVWRRVRDKVRNINFSHYTEYNTNTCWTINFTTFFNKLKSPLKKVNTT